MDYFEWMLMDRSSYPSWHNPIRVVQLGMGILGILGTLVQHLGILGILGALLAVHFHVIGILSHFRGFGRILTRPGNPRCSIPFRPQ